MWRDTFVFVAAVFAFFCGACLGVTTQPAPTAVQDRTLNEVGECRRLASKYEAELEVRLWDGTRVDMLTPTHAIEVDWAHKWAEAVGQSLYYSELTGKPPGVLLLVRDMNTEERYVYRCQTLCAKLGIKLYVEQASR